MEIKRHNTIVILSSLLIATGFALIRWKSHDPQHIESRVFQVNNGWGYDILVDKKTIIHQAYIPGQPGMSGFPEKDQAERTAELIINKIQGGRSPTITKFEINQICASTTENGEQGKHQ